MEHLNGSIMIYQSFKRVRLLQLKISVLPLMAIPCMPLCPTSLASRHRQACMGVLRSRQGSRRNEQRLRRSNLFRHHCEIEDRNARIVSKHLLFICDGLGSANNSLSKTNGASDIDAANSYIIYK